jgi:hypothetical protein
MEDANQNVRRVWDFELSDSRKWNVARTDLTTCRVM